MEILGISLLIPIVVISMSALFAALTLLIPAPVEATRLNLENGMKRAILLGLVNFIFFAALVILFGWLAEQTGTVLSSVFVLLAGLIALGLAIFAILGLTAFANLLGERMGTGMTPLKSNLRGGVLLLLAGFAPYVGWFIFTPLILWAGLGAAISAIIRKRDVPASIDGAA